MRTVVVGLLIGCGKVLDAHEGGGDGAIADVANEAPHKHSCKDDIDASVSVAPRFARVFRGGAGFLALDRCGNIYVAGEFRIALDTGDGPRESKGDYDGFLVKLDPAGRVVWTKTFGTELVDFVTRVGIDGEDNVVILGVSAGELDLGGGPLERSPTRSGSSFLARFDGAGNHIASTRSSHRLLSMSVDGDDTFVFGVHATGMRNIALERLSIGFDPIWTDTLNAGSLAVPYAVIATPGGLLIGGTLDGAITISGKTMPAPSNSAYVAAFDRNGANLWTYPFGCTARPPSGPGDGRTVLRALGVSPNGGFVATGEFSGSSCDIGGGPWSGVSDIFVSKHTKAGNPLWVTRFVSTDSWDTGGAVAEDAAGNVIVTGGFQSSIDVGDQTLTSAGSMDIFIAKLDPNGKTIFSKRFGGPELDFGYDVKVDGTGSIFATGSFGKTADFGDGPVTTPDNGFYVLKLEP